MDKQAPHLHVTVVPIVTAERKKRRRDCTHIGFPDQMTQRILAQQSVGFSVKLYSPKHEKKFSTENSEAKLERDPEKKHCFILQIDGVSVFQWLYLTFEKGPRNSN